MHVPSGLRFACSCHYCPQCKYGAAKGGVCIYRSRVAVSKRAAAPPPVLPGYTPLHLVGSGGYADVYLYEQHMPARQVAVKVLVPSALTAEATSDAFTAEANLMARVSAHPYIVQVFQAAISPDGRPYLVMEYYPGANYYERARREQMPVADVLRTGIQLASAVETAHRAGILHRDIKPANVLTSEFRRPGLTDFGIASAQGPDTSTEGLSIPWSPPESFGDGNLDVRSDVYSLAATLYTLLVGRSPFEVSSGDNSPLSLVSRIERQPLPATMRADVPASLERVLASAMAKNPAHRPATAVELARLLQAIESELRLSSTPLELADDAVGVRSRTDVIDDDSTRVKGITEVRAQSSALIDAVPAQPSGRASTPTPERRREGLLAEPEISDTIHRPVPATPVGVATPTTRGRGPVLIGAAVVVLLAGIGAFAAFGRGGQKATDSTDVANVNDGVGGAVVAATPLPVTDLRGEAGASGAFAFTWTAPLGGPVTYTVTEVGTNHTANVSATSYASSASCVEVASAAANGVLSSPVKACVS